MKVNDFYHVFHFQILKIVEIQKNQLLLLNYDNNILLLILDLYFDLLYELKEKILNHNYYKLFVNSFL